MRMKSLISLLYLIKNTGILRQRNDFFESIMQKAMRFIWWHSLIFYTNLNFTGIHSPFY